MLARIATSLSLLIAVTLVGCARAPEPLAKSEEAPKVATLEVGEPVVIEPLVQEEKREKTLLEREMIAIEDGDTTDYVAAGKKYLEEKRGLEAVGMFRLALSKSNTPDIWEQLGEAYLLAGDDERGLACLEEAVTKDVGLASARKTLAKRYLAMNDGEKARIHADELVRLRPLDASSRQILGRALMQQKMWKEAIAQFSEVVTEDPDNIYAHNNLGYSAIQIGELALAREHLERTLSLEPQQGYMLNNLGVVYERLGRHAEAHAAFSRAAELSPKYASAKLNRDRVQASLTHDERIVAAEVLLQMREPAIIDGMVPPNGAVEVDATSKAIEAATGGSMRMAPSIE